MNKRIIITTAKILDEGEQEAITTFFATKLGIDKSEIDISFLVNDEIIGGMIVFDGEKLYDGSIRHRLEKIKSKIKK